MFRWPGFCDASTEPVPKLHRRDNYFDESVLPSNRTKANMLNNAESGAGTIKVLKAQRN